VVIADWKKGKLIPIYQEKETFSLVERLKVTEDLNLRRGLCYDIKGYK
jgi:hypothetical protein